MMVDAEVDNAREEGLAQQGEQASLPQLRRPRGPELETTNFDRYNDC